MICQRILPSLELRSLIREYLTIHFEFFPSKKVPPKAYPVNPEEGIRFLVKGTLHAESPDLGTLEKRPTVTLFGQPIYRENLYSSNQYFMIHIRFQPGGIFKLFGIPMVELIHQNLDAALVVGPEIKEVQERLDESKTYTAMHQVLNEYFTQKLRRRKDTSQPIDKIAPMILEKPKDFHLDKTASDACLSHRQFERRFLQLVGVSPKHYARICRFYQADVLKDSQPNLDWMSVAIQTGYHDYQHLVKDFKQFAGTSPIKLIAESQNNPERRFDALKGFRGV